MVLCKRKFSVDYGHFMFTVCYIACGQKIE